MNTVSVSKIEYETLKAESAAYKRLIRSAQIDYSLTPPTRSKSKVLSGFKNTGKYNKEFIVSLQKGLKRSSYFDQK